MNLPVKDALPEDWRAWLAAEFQEPYWGALAAFLAEERAAGEVFPAPDEVFSAFHMTPVKDVRVLLLGQDPYHDAGQAHGLCFSVRPGIRIPPSLANVFKELHSDLGIEPPRHGDLGAWARQGVLMLNAVLTVRAHQPNSHKGRGWETFTDQVIRRLNAQSSPAVFVLWGNYARKKAKLIDRERHRVIESGHPSPLSAKHFMGTKPFSAINRALRELGRGEIDWRLPPYDDPGTARRAQI